MVPQNGALESVDSNVTAAGNNYSDMQAGLELKASRFPEKAYLIIQRCELTDPEIAGWNETGDEVVIRDKALMEKKYLSASFESFVRQLQLYGFKKVNDNRNRSNKGSNKGLIFRHEAFKRDNPGLLVNVKTSAKNDDKSKVDKKSKVQKGRDKPSTVSKENKSSNSEGSSVPQEKSIQSLHHRLDKMDLKMDQLTARFDQLLNILVAASAPNRNSSPALSFSKPGHKRARSEQNNLDTSMNVNGVYGRRVSNEYVQQSSGIASSVSNQAHPKSQVYTVGQGMQSDNLVIGNKKISDLYSDQEKAIFYDVKSGEPHFGNVFDEGSESGPSSVQIHKNNLHNAISEFTDDELAQIAAMDTDSFQEITAISADNGGAGYGLKKMTASDNRRKSLMLFSTMALVGVIGGLIGSLVTTQRNNSVSPPSPPSPGSPTAPVAPPGVDVGGGEGNVIVSEPTISPTPSSMSLP